MTSETPQCNWFARRWHRRLRKADLAIMWPAIDSRTADAKKRHDAWELFIHQPGQEHWLCECAKEGQ